MSLPHMTKISIEARCRKWQREAQHSADLAMSARELMLPEKGRKRTDYASRSKFWASRAQDAHERSLYWLLCLVNDKETCVKAGTRT